MLNLRQSGISRDILAGLTLAAIGIPEVMGYTRIIGTPVITGIYTLLLPALVFAVVGSSRHLVIGADSATAAIVASALMGMAAPSSAEYLLLTSVVALLAGLFLLVARVLNLGFIASFLSRTVLIGFLSGVGVQVALSQFHGMLGTQVRGLEILNHLSQIHFHTALISVVVVSLLMAFRLWAPRWPGPLLVVGGMIGASYFFDFKSLGIEVLGEIPSGLPHLGWPDLTWDRLLKMFSVAGSCAVVILAQSAATSRAYAVRYGEPLNENRDLVGLGLGNLAAAFTGTFVVNGSPTKTEILDAAGGRSQWAQITTAAAALAVILFLTAPLAFLPNAVLAAVVFVIGVNLIDVAGLRDIYRLRRVEFFLALVTAITVIGIGVEQGILLAMILSLLNHVRNSYQPRTAIVTRESGDWQMNSKITPAAQVEPGLLIYWFGADLFYANIDRFASEVEELVSSAKTPVEWLAIDAGAITAIDYSANKELVRITDRLKARKTDVVWVRMSLAHPPPGKLFATREDCRTEFLARRSVVTR